MTENSPLLEPDAPLDALSFLLPVEMTIENAEKLTAEFKKVLGDGRVSLTLDASQVENITTPGMQLIAALGKTLQQRGGALVIDGKGAGFTRAFADVGLENLIATRER